jgi:hypothetical protein
MEPSAFETYRFVFSQLRDAFVYTGLTPSTHDDSVFSAASIIAWKQRIW